MTNKIRLSTTVDSNSSNIRITTTTSPKTLINTSAETAFLLGRSKNTNDSAPEETVVEEEEKWEPDTWGGNAPD